MGILGNSFQDIIHSYQAYGKAGLKNIFANSTTDKVTSMDIEMLKNFNNEISNGVPKAQALEETMFGASKGARELAMSADTSTEGLKAFDTKLKTLEISEKGYIATTIGAKIATVALQAAISFGITMAIQGLIAGFQTLADLLPTVENTSKWLEESSREVQDMQSKIDELNGELKTTNDRIAELQAKGNLTIVEQNELSNLKQVSAEIERQIELEERRLKIKQAQNAGNFVKAFNAKTTDLTSGWDSYGDNDTSVVKDVNGNWRDTRDGANATQKEMFEYRLNDYKQAQKKYQEALKQGNTEEAQKWQDRLDILNTAMSGYVTDLEGYLDELGEYDYSTLSDDAQKAIDYIRDIQNAYLMTTGADSDSVFSNVFNQERFAEGKVAIEQLNETGKLTADTFKTLYDSNDNVKAMIDNMQEVGLVNDLTAESFAGLTNQITETQRVVGTIAKDEKVAFSDFIANENTQETINSFKDSLSDLSQALEDFRNGDLNDSDLFELYEKFPELVSRSDDLDAALSDLINTTQQEVDSQFEEWEKDMPTQEDIDNLNGVKDTLNAIGDTANSISKAAGEIEKLKSALDDLKSTYDDIQDVIDDYNENEYLTLDNLQSIMDLEPEYINLLIDENGQINLNNQAYKDYVISKAKSLLVNQLTSLYDTILGMKVEEAQAYANAKAHDEETRSVEDLLTATTQLYILQARQKDIENNTTAYTDALTRSFSTAANYAALVDSYINSLNSTQNEFSTITQESTSALESQKEALEKQKDVLEDEKKALEDAKDALEDYKDSLEGAQDDIQSLIDLVVDYIKQMKEDEKEAINEQIDLLNKQKDSLNDQKDKYGEVIDKKKEAIKLAYDEKKAADELADKQKSVAKDALALAVANLDNSSAGKKSQKQAQDNLALSQKELSDYLYEEEYNSRIKALEEEEDAFNKSIDRQTAKIDKHVEKLKKQITKIDKYLKNSRKIYRDACNMIDREGKKLYDKLWSYVYKHTTMTKAEFNHLWASAQTAIKKYQGDNESLISVMERLQGKIYSTDTKIANLNKQIDKTEDKIGKLDDAISATSSSIESTSGAIKSVSSSLGGLGGSISNYIQKLKDLAKVQDELDKKKKKSYKYYYKYMGKTYKSKKSNRESAISDIVSQIKKDYNNKPPLSYDVYHGIQAYAKGTRSSNGGLAITQEDGLEAIFGKLPNGRYTIMPQGSQVFDHERTDELYNFSGDPEGYLAKLAERGLTPLSSDELNAIGWGNSLDVLRFKNMELDSSAFAKTITNSNSKDIYNNGDTSNNQNITINMPIQIQGNADQSTVQALNRFMPTFKKEIIKELVRIGEKHRR